MAEPHLIILAVMDHQIRKKRSAFQIAFDFDALHADPGITPGIMPVCFVIDQFSGADQKSVALVQPEQFAPGFVDAGAV